MLRKFGHILRIDEEVHSCALGKEVRCCALGSESLPMKFPCGNIAHLAQNTISGMEGGLAHRLEKRCFFHNSVVNPNLYGDGGRGQICPPGSFLLLFKNGWR